MSIFWFVSGMLTMFAVLVLLLPWLRTIPRLENLPAVPWQAPLVALMVIGAALALYARLGRPELMARSALPVAGDAQPHAAGGAGGGIGAGAGAGVGAGANAAGSMSTAIASLRTRLATGRGGPEDWELLAKSYEFIGRPDQAALTRAHQLPNAEPQPPAPAAAAVDLTPQSLALLSQAARARNERQYAAAVKIYEQLAAARQMNADAWADYADTAATLQGDKLAGEPERLIENALILAPDHPKALWLKASAEEEAGRYAAAITTWQRLQAVLPQSSQDANIVAANMQRDRVALAADGAGEANAASAAAGPRISGEVSLAGALSGKAIPGATLFIVAKSVDAPGPPLAIYRGRVGAWPVKFSLDDSSAMLPGRTLSSAKRVTVEARISRSGRAQPAAGDLRGTTGVIDPSSHQPLKILINEEVS